MESLARGLDHTGPHGSCLGAGNWNGRPDDCLCPDPALSLTIRLRDGKTVERTYSCDCCQGALPAAAVLVVKRIERDALELFASRQARPNPGAGENEGSN